MNFVRLIFAKMNFEIIPCDFFNPLHRQKVVELTRDYMLDPMGSGEVMPDEVQNKLADSLASHPACMVLFALVNGQFTGIITSFINLSTFKAKPYFNVHDIALLKEYRGLGIGRMLLEKVIEIARERDYCKVTLEVRDDNHNAKQLYMNLGFEDCEPRMHFWTKTL
jgi:ribosomal protein S18 acetylase RimI-like enzyme